jgi:hypothetical protein
MKGQQQITLSYDSVREAIEHYLHEHFAQNVQVSVAKWRPVAAPRSAEQQYNPDPESVVVVDFTQAEDTPPPGISITGNTITEGKSA